MIQISTYIYIQKYITSIYIGKNNLLKCILLKFREITQKNEKHFIENSNLLSKQRHHHLSQHQQQKLE
jgi:hypothetical protein